MDIINIQGGIVKVVQVTEDVYSVVDGKGNVFTVTKAQLATLPTSTTINEGKQLILE